MRSCSGHLKTLNSLIIKGFTFRKPRSLRIVPCLPPQGVSLLVVANSARLRFSLAAYSPGLRIYAKHLSLLVDARRDRNNTKGDDGGPHTPFAWNDIFIRSPGIPRLNLLSDFCTSLTPIPLVSPGEPSQMTRLPGRHSSICFIVAWYLASRSPSSATCW
jgi:hypothetical protein